MDFTDQYTSDAAEAEIFENSAYVPHGNHLVIIEKAVIINSRSKPGTAFLIVECTTIVSDNPEAPYGHKFAWRNKLGPKGSPGNGNFKQFGLAVGQTIYEDFAESKVSKKVLDSIIKEEQAAAGHLIALGAWGITTKAGNPFTATKWAAPTEAQEAQAQAAAQAAA